MKQFRFGCGLLIVLVASFLLSGCAHDHHSAAHRSRITVTASVDFYGDAARAVLGRDGTVHSLINTSGVDPHDFQPTPRAAEDVSKSNVLLANGLGYDSWMNALARDAPRAKRVTVGHLVDKSTGDNPHVWYRLWTLPRLTAYLANDFSRLEPRHQAAFHRRARAYVRSLRPVLELAARLRKRAGHRRVDVSEPVFNYALHNLGYRVNDPGYSRAVEDDTDPTPGEIRRVQNDFKFHRVAFLVQNVQTSNTLTNQLLRSARRYHIPILRVSETMPDRENYRTWQLRQYQQLARIQTAEKRRSVK